MTDLTMQDVLEYFSLSVHSNPTIIGTAEVPSGKYAGRVGLHLEVTNAYDDNYRGFAKGQPIRFVLFRRDDGKRTAYFDAETQALADAGIKAYRAAH